MSKYGETISFVVQKHTKPEEIHWDLMLENDGSLATWRVELPPNEWFTTPLFVTKIADHDPKFLTYTGPVNNNTASVIIAEKGTFYVEKWDENCITGAFSGSLIQARCDLTRDHNDLWKLQLQPVNP